MATTTLRTVASATLLHDSIILVREILRNGITDPQSRGTSDTDTFDGDDSTVAFTLDNQPLNATAVTVGGTAQTMGVDYTLAYATKIITFTTAPASGSDNVSVTYKYSTTAQSLVYTAFPEANVVYPIIVIGHTGQRDEWASIGADYKEVTINLSIDVFSTSTKERDELWDNVYNTLRSNQSTLEKNGLTDLIVTRAINMDAEAIKRRGGLHRKAGEIQLTCYAT